MGVITQEIIGGVIGLVLGSALVLAWDWGVGEWLSETWYVWRHRHDPPRKPISMEMWNYALLDAQRSHNLAIITQVFDDFRDRVITGEGTGTFEGIPIIEDPMCPPGQVFLLDLDSIKWGPAIDVTHRDMSTVTEDELWPEWRDHGGEG